MAESDIQFINRKRELRKNRKIDPFIPCPIKEQFVEITDDIDSDIMPIYLISNIGRVYNKKSNKFLYGTPEHTGYIRVNLITKNKRIKYCPMHRLVIKAFKPIPENWDQLQINHIDGIKQHNWITNLEWVTAHENSIHAIKNNLRVVSPTSKLNEEKVHEICKLLQYDKLTHSEIAKRFDVKPNTISNIQNKKSWVDISNQYDFSNRIKSNVKLTEKDIIDICELILSGKSNKYIASLYNVSPNTISNLRNVNSWQNITSKYFQVHERKSVDKSNVLNSDQIVEICKLIESGMYNDSEIAKMFGVDYTTINKIHNGKSWTHISKDFDLSKRNNDFRYRK